MYRFKPVKDQNNELIAMECSLAFLVNPGRIPWFVVSRVLSAHAGMLESQITHMIKNKDRLL
jgi:hypothetical protein